MNTVTIHESGASGDKLRVDSIGNGMAYAVHFGETGAPMRDLFFQGEDATILRADFDALEDAQPDESTRSVWLFILGDYL